MATPLDTTLIQLMTGGVNMPTQAQAAAGYVPRAFVDSAGRVNLEYVAPSTFGADVANVVDSGAAGDGVTNDAAAFNAAVATGKAEVFIPDGEYLISSAVTFNVDDAVITFAPGAVVKITPNAGSLTFSGARQNISGLRALVATASSATVTLVTSSGVGTVLNNITFDVDADVSNASLIKLAGARTTLNNYKLIGAGKEFKYGVHLETLAAGAVDSVTVDGLDIDVGDDGVDATFGALIYLKGVRCEIANLQFEGGGRSLFPNGVVIIEGGKNTLRKPKIFATAATYGLYLVAASEFLEIYGGHIQGRNNGTYQANSYGIYCAGNFAGGHLKMFQTSITGWNDGMIFKGGADTPLFVGVTIANNNDYGIVVDTAGAGGLFISSWTFSGCYLGDVTQASAVHFLTGTVIGMTFDNCQIGIGEAATGFVVDAGFTQLSGVVFNSGRFLGASGGASEYVFEPNVNTSQILFINPTYHSIAAKGTGTYAAKCIDVTDPILTGLVIGTQDAAGTSNNHMTRFFTDIYTANFGNIGAGAIVQLNFSFTGVTTTTTSQLVATMGSALGAFCAQGIVFQWWVNATNQISGTAWNPTGSTINSVTGGIRFGVTIFG